jgi:hypothetical protein
MKLKFSRQIFGEGKNSNMKFHQNPSSRSRVFPCGRKDTHDEANSRFSQFRERAKEIRILKTQRIYVVHNDSASSLVFPPYRGEGV